MVHYTLREQLQATIRSFRGKLNRWLRAEADKQFVNGCCAITCSISYSGALVNISRIARKTCIEEQSARRQIIDELKELGREQKFLNRNSAHKKNDRKIIFLRHGATKAIR